MKQNLINDVMSSDFDLENFTKEVFFMFSGDRVQVDLRCDNSLMKMMIVNANNDILE